MTIHCSKNRSNQPRQPTPGGRLEWTQHGLAASLLGFVVGIVALAACAGCKPAITLQSIAEVANATNIVFTERYGSDSNEWKHLTVSDTNELRRFVSFAQLRTKRPCDCAHHHEALFQSSSGEVRVSFCNHCFDVENGQSPGGYAMPKEFYDEFYRLVQQQTNDEWHLSPPRYRR